ncbi:MAG: uncharacterized protein KVP18_001251 [Porospora cf. gigantea A]|uniref:uncharacterized protein n=2 Tax=Porospora cf. gigantea A TaxID=2853593 RepID=UPI00355A655D|nr:MAG: hypothetical protein KVP18_001251 [Porospora cf. gigantea A]
MDAASSISSDRARTHEEMSFLSRQLNNIFGQLGVVLGLSLTSVLWVQSIMLLGIGFFQFGLAAALDTHQLRKIPNRTISWFLCPFVFKREIPLVAVLVRFWTVPVFIMALSAIGGHLIRRGLWLRLAARLALVWPLVIGTIYVLCPFKRFRDPGYNYFYSFVGILIVFPFYWLFVSVTWSLNRVTS